MMSYNDLLTIMPVKPKIGMDSEYALVATFRNVAIQLNATIVDSIILFLAFNLEKPVYFKDFNGNEFEITRSSNCTANIRFNDEIFHLTQSETSRLRHTLRQATAHLRK